MRQWRMRAIGIAVGVLCTLASTPGATSEEAGAPLLFWQVRGKNADNTSVYLLGAVAVPNTTMLRFDPVVIEAFDSSDRLALPDDTTRSKPNEALALMTKKGLLPEGETLRDRLPAELYQRVVAHLEAEGIPAERADPMVPWFVALLLRSSDLERMQYVAEHEFAYYFDGLAAGSKEVRILSTGSEAFDRGNALSPEAQLGTIELALAGSEGADESLPAVYAAWQSGDVEVLDSTLSAALRERPELLAVWEETLFAENSRLAGEVEKLLGEGGTSFLIAPALQLVGDRGVLQLLRQGGHVVEQQHRKGG